jgi:Mg-chelatase subunit ChlD
MDTHLHFLKEGFMASVYRQLLAAVALLSCVGFVTAEEKTTAAKKSPNVEVVFCLDTTGSMGGLIEGAKQKIWAISNQIASGKPTPRLRIGLVPFRDRGDVYITKVIDLTDDLDAIYSQLREFKAEGGGDEPESVNQALNDSVTKIKWSSDPKTLRIIFLVGDAPPHMDYPDDVKYPVTCKLAAEKGIIINTVQCGASAETRKYWQDICRKAEGEFVQIAQDGGVVAVATPYDKDLERLNAELTKTTLTYGDRREQALGLVKVSEAMALAAPIGGADRAAYAAKSGRVASFDLLDSIKDGKVRLDSIRPEHLPPELQKLSPKERQEYLNKLDKRRTEIRKEVLKLDKSRSDFIAKKLAGDKGQAKDGFDNQVLDILRKQAKKCAIEY